MQIKTQEEKKTTPYFQMELKTIKRDRDLGLGNKEELNRQEIEILKQYEQHLNGVIKFYLDEREGYISQLETDTENELIKVKKRLSELEKSQKTFFNSLFVSFKLRKFLKEMTNKTK